MMASEEAVIVVVGGETKDKARVAEALAKARGASVAETTKGGVRIFRKKGSPDAAVIDTTPLIIHRKTTPLIIHRKTSQLLEMAEMWISLNALRRLYGKLICVICVLPSSGPEDSIHCKFDFEAMYLDKFNWLHLLGYIFAERKRNILLLVKLLEGTNDSGAVRRGVTDALQRDGYVEGNISFENMDAEDLIPMVTRTLQRSVFVCTSSKEKSIPAIQFRFKEVTSKSKDLDRYGCWAPARVILMGRTGSGKSTLYQMLTKGRLDPSSKCAASSSIRGETKAVTSGEGRGWHVIDTPGFGELKDKQSTISTEEAHKRIRNYVSRIDGTYSHFIYVVMKDRIDMLDKKLWKFFQLLFEGVQNVTVVISNATQTWVDQNLSALQADFSGCDNFLSGEFPPTVFNDAEWEAELEEVRGESLNRLDDELASLSRFNTSYADGDISRGTIQRIAIEFDRDLRLGNLSFEEKAAVLVVKPLAKIWLGGLKFGFRTARAIDRLAEMLKDSDEEFTLLPP